MIPVYKPRVFSESALKAIESSWISSQGIYIEKAAKSLSDFMKVPHVILTNNGTAATHMLVKSIRFKYPNVRSIYAPNNVFVAVWNSVLYEYEKSSLKILEVNPLTLNMRTDEEYISSLERNAAVMIVHNVGNIVNVPRLKRLRPDLIFVEDNCEGFFGTYEGIFSGTSTASLCSAVSFFANKTITCGEGGAFFTHDKELYDYIYCIVNQGTSFEKYKNKYLGYNYRMTNIQAALLFDQLSNIECTRNDKHEVLKYYKNNLKNYVVFPEVENNTESSEWMFICGIKGVYKDIEAHMKEAGVDIRPFFYDINVHSHLSSITRIPVHNENTYIMLPSYPDLSDAQLHHICTRLVEFITTQSC